MPLPSFYEGVGRLLFALSPPRSPRRYACGSRAAFARPRCGAHGGLPLATSLTLAARGGLARAAILARAAHIGAGWARDGVGLVFRRAARTIDGVPNGDFASV